MFCSSSLIRRLGFFVVNLRLLEVRASCWVCGLSGVFGLAPKPVKETPGVQNRPLNGQNAAASLLGRTNTTHDSGVLGPVSIWGV